MHCAGVHVLDAGLVLSDGVQGCEDTGARALVWALQQASRGGCFWVGAGPFAGAVPVEIRGRWVCVELIVGVTDNRWWWDTGQALGVRLMRVTAFT